MSLTLDDLALFADHFHGRPYLHRWFLLSELRLAAPGDTASGEVVGRQFDGDLIAGIDADVVHAHFAGNMSQNLMTVGQLYFEHSVGIRFRYNAFNFDNIGLGQFFTPPRAKAIGALHDRIPAGRLSISKRFPVWVRIPA